MAGSDLNFTVTAEDSQRDVASDFKVKITRGHPPGTEPYELPLSQLVLQRRFD